MQHMTECDGLLYCVWHSNVPKKGKNVVLVVMRIHISPKIARKRKTIFPTGTIFFDFGSFERHTQYFPFHTLNVHSNGRHFNVIVGKRSHLVPSVGTLSIRILAADKPFSISLWLPRDTLSHTTTADYTNNRTKIIKMFGLVWQRL